MSLPSNNYRIALTSLIFIFAILSSCTNSDDLRQKAEKEILEQHHLQRKHHLEKMAPELAKQLSEKHIAVNRGRISTPSLEENTKRFNAYFNAVNFEKWDDLTPPIIRFSDDFSLAYTIVNKEVVVTFNNEQGEKVRDKTEFSWVAIYKKYNGKWKVDCMASTNLPGISELIPD